MRRRFSLLLVALLGSLLIGAACNGADTRSLTILHTNDLHAHFLPDDHGRGGFAQLATAIRMERERSRATLVLNAGDLVQGTPVSSIFEGVPCYEVASRMGFDASVLGNHEFDYTWRKIPDFVAAASFPIVTANVVDPNGRLLAPAPYVILERGGLRVGVIGVLLERLDELTKAHQRGDWRVLPVAETVRRYAREIEDKTDLIVVLGHLYEEEEKEILETVPEVDVVVSGHNHAGLREPVVVDGRILVRVRSYGVELGRLDLEVDRKTGTVASHRWRIIKVNSSDYPADPDVEALVDKWESKVSEVVDVPIGTSKREIRQEEVRKMIEEAMADAVGADLAFTNAGGVRDVIPEGEILVRHIWNILPFGNRIVYGRLYGRDLPEALRQGRKIDPGKLYTVATNDFIEEQWRTRDGVKLTEQGPLVREALIDYIKERRVLE